MPPEEQVDLVALEKRVSALEATNAVSHAAFDWVRTADKVETYHRIEDVRHLFYELMTEDGWCDFEGAGWGTWGPDKEEMVEQFMNFAAKIDWAYHIYPNAKVEVDLDKGEATFWTACEVVPLKMDGKPQWLFLTSHLSFKLVDGAWKVACYKLSDPRIVLADGSDW